MSDLLKIDSFNNLQHPLFCRFGADKHDSLIETVCVQTGLMRIDVYGQIDLRQIGEVIEIVDGDGNRYDVDDFYIDSEQEPKPKAEQTND